MSVRPLLSSETNKIIDEFSLIFNGIHVLGSCLFSTSVSEDGAKYRFFSKKNYMEVIIDFLNYSTKIKLFT